MALWRRTRPSRCVTFTVKQLCGEDVSRNLMPGDSLVLTDGRPVMRVDLLKSGDIDITTLAPWAVLSDELLAGLTRSRA